MILTKIIWFFKIPSLFPRYRPASCLITFPICRIFNTFVFPWHTICHYRVTERTRVTPDVLKVQQNLVMVFAGQYLAMNLCSHKPIHITRGIIRWLYLSRHSEQDNPNLVLSLAHKSIGSNRLPCNPSLSTALRKLPVRNIMAKILWLNANLENAQGYSKKSCIKLLSV